MNMDLSSASSLPGREQDAAVTTSMFDVFCEVEEVDETAAAGKKTGDQGPDTDRPAMLVSNYV